MYKDDEIDSSGGSGGDNESLWNWAGNLRLHCAIIAFIMLVWLDNW